MIGGNDNTGGGEERKYNKFLIKDDTILETEFLKGEIMVKTEEKSTETIKEEWNKQTCYNELETTIVMVGKRICETKKKEIGYYYSLKF